MNTAFVFGGARDGSTACLPTTDRHHPPRPTRDHTLLWSLRRPPPHVLVPTNSTWALPAWGFPNGGKDPTAGRKVVDIDIDLQKEQIPALHAAGHIVVCYFSTGTTEPFRQDYKDNEAAWTAVAAGKMAEWDESWLDITRLPELQALMEPRFQRAKAQGCDAVEPGNVDCYDNKGKGDQQGGDYERRQCICRVFLHGARIHSYTRLYIHAYTGALHTLIRPVSCPYREEGLLGYGVSLPSPPSCTESSVSSCGPPLATT